MIEGKSTSALSTSAHMQRGGHYACRALSPFPTSHSSTLQAALLHEVQHEKRRA